MDISLDYINKVIARNNANTGAGAQAPASFGNYTGFEGDAPTVARMRENQVQAAIASASARKEAYQQAVQQHRADMQQIRQRNNLKAQEKGGSKAKQYDAVQEYLRDNPAAEKLWTAEHTPAPNPQAAAGRKKQAEELRKGMTGAELSAYEQAEKTAKGYGRLYGGARRLQDMTAGALKQAGSSALAFMEGMATGDEDNKRAQWEMRQAVDNGTVFTAPDENGNSVVSDAYKQALKEFEDTKDNEVIIDESFSPALKATRKATEQIARGGAGLSAPAKKAYEVGTSMVQNAPSMAIGLIPGVGSAVGLGMMGLSAAGGRMDELSQQGVGNREAMVRGAVSGAIEIATEKLPLDTWTEIITKGGETALRNIAKQAFGEATEEGVGYIMNFIADKAFQDPNAEFSLAEMADSALMGGLSGAGFGAIGTGINRALGLGANTNVQQNEQTEAAQNEQTAMQAQETGTEQSVSEHATAQQASEAERTMQARRAAAEQLAPLTGLTPEQLLNTAQMEAPQNAVQQEQSAVQRSAESVPAGTQEAAQAAPADTQTEQARMIQERNTQAVAEWADSNEDFSPEMKRLVKANYAPGANAGLYTTAMQNYYDAGRTGSITYEQAQQMNQSRAAAINNEPLLRAAYEAGRKQAVNVTDAAGTGAVQGRVQYEDGAVKGAVLDDSILQAVADKLGVDIRVVHQLTDTNGAEANGSFAAGMSQIVLGENSSNAYQTLTHELTHYIGSYAPEQMSELRNAALRFYAEQSGTVRSTLRQYESSYGNYTLGADEAARDVLSGVMSTEDGARSFLEYITQSDAYTPAQKHSILQTMRDVLETLIQKLRDLLVGGDATETAGKARQIAEQADMMEQRQAMIDQYMSALEDARQKAHGKAEGSLQSSAEVQQTETAPAASRGGERYSIETDDKGRKYVQQDREVLQGDDPAEWGKQLYDYINHTIRQGNDIVVQAEDGTPLTISEKTAWKMSDRHIPTVQGSKKRYMTDTAYAQKLNAAGHIDEIAAVSKGGNTAADTKAHGFAKDGFEYRTAYYKDTAGNLYRLTVSVGKNGEVNTVYNIGRMTQKKNPQVFGATKAQTAGKQSPSAEFNSSIAQRSENINTEENAQKKTVQSLGATKALTAEKQSSSATVNNSIAQRTENINTSDTVEDLAARKQALKAERNAYESSEAVRQLKAARENAKRMYGLFGGGLNTWEAQHPEWGEYVAKRKDYNRQLSALDARTAEINEQGKADLQARQNAQWVEKQTQQKAYDARVQESGLSIADYHRQEAINHYGTTENFEAAAYLLPDGQMLDFTEGNAGEQRGADHRNIQTIFGPAELGQNAAQADYLNRFIEEGNIRLMPESPGVDLSATAQPTKAQLAKIAEMAETLGRSEGSFSLDITGENGKQAAGKTYEGRIRGAEVVRDIEAYFETGKLPEQSELNKFRYSTDTAQSDSDAYEGRAWQEKTASELDKLRRKRTKIDSQIKTLQEEMRISGGHTVAEADVQRAAKRFISENGSQYNADLFARELQQTFDSMSRSKNLNVREAMSTLTDLAKGVLEQSVKMNYDLREEYAPVREAVKGMEWTVRENSPAYDELVNRFGDGANGKKWGNVRKALFGTLNIKRISADGPAGTFDTNFEILAKQFPGEFTADGDVAANVERLMQIKEASKPYYENIYGNDLDEAASFAAQDLYDAYIKAQPVNELNREQVQRLRELNRTYERTRAEAMAAQKAAFDAKIADMKQESRESFNERMQGIYDKYTAAQKAGNEALAEKYLREMEQGYATRAAAERSAALEMRWKTKNDSAERIKARDSVQKSVKELHRWLTQPTADQHVQTRMQKTVLKLLNSIDVNNSVEGTQNAARWQEVMKDVQLMAKDALAADGGLSDTDAYADFDPDLPEAINELMQGNDHARIVDFDVKQMRQLRDILTSIKTSIRNANKMMSDAQGATVDEICRSSAVEMNDERNVLLKERSRLVRKLMGTRTGDAVNGLLNYDMMDARRYFKHLGNTALEKVYKPIRDGFDRRVWLLKSAQEQFEQIRGDTDISKWTGSKAEKHRFTLENGQQIDMTVGQMMELYNLSQREQAHDHLMVGGFTLVDENGKKTSARVRSLTPTDLASITGTLTNEQVKMAKAMSDYLSAKNGPAGWGNEVTQKQYGLDKFNEKHYWPLKSDGNQTRTSDANVGGNAGLWAIKNQGFTKNLTKFANNSILLGDAFDTWSNHVANMATYNAWAIPLSDAMKWYNWHDGVEVSTKEQIEGIGGSRGKAYFTTLMQDINGMSATPSSTGYASLTKSLTRNWKVAKVGSNLRVAIQQPTAYLRAAAVIDPKYLTQAIAYDVGHLTQGMDRAENNCAIALWKSWGYFETNIGQTMKNVLTGQSDTLDKVREISTWAAEMGDKITWGTLWNACELEAQAQYGFKPGSEESLKYCGERLSEIVDKTQVVDSVLHRSQIMRSKDMLTQMATNFFAEPTKTYNMVEDAFLDMAHGKEGAKKNFGRVVATYFATAAGTAIAASLIDALRVKDEDKDKGYWERYKEALYENFVDNVNLINNIPFVKDIQSMLDGYDATRTDLESVSDIIDAVKAWQKYLTGQSKTTPYKLLYKTANAVSGVTGIPMGTAVREAKSAYDLFTGLMDPLRIDRQLGRAEDDYTYIDLYNQVKAAGGDTKEMKALYNGESYADMLGSDRAASVDEWLKALAKNTATVDDAGKMQDNTSVLAKHIDNEISYKDADGNDRKAKLKGPEYVTYAKAVQQSTVNLIDEYMRGAGKTAGAEQQAAFVKRAREYAVETAREQIILGYKPDSWVQAVQSVSGGKNIAAVIVAREAANSAKSDLDKDGNAISGSKAANGVKALQALGYDAATAQVLYNQLTGAEDNRYMKLYNSVKANSTKVHKLAALYGTAGEDTTYAGMLQNSKAQKVDNYLLELSKTQGNDVLPDRMSADFKAGDKDVNLSGEQYIDYAEQRTKTAYTLTDALLPNAAKYTKEQQAKIVANIEEYATQTAKAQVSGYEPYSWIRTVEERGATDEERYAYITAKTLISLAKGTKDSSGKTISGSKKAAAINSLKQAGYNDAMAKELYKLFG